jgi:hypothetical protein
MVGNFFKNPIKTTEKNLKKAEHGFKEFVEDLKETGKDVKETIEKPIKDHNKYQETFDSIRDGNLDLYSRLLAEQGVNPCSSRDLIYTSSIDDRFLLTPFTYTIEKEKVDLLKKTLDFLRENNFTNCNSEEVYHGTIIAIKKHADSHAAEMVALLLQDYLPHPNGSYEYFQAWEKVQHSKGSAEIFKLLSTKFSGDIQFLDNHSKTEVLLEISKNHSFYLSKDCNHNPATDVVLAHFIHGENLCLDLSGKENEILHTEL